MLFVGAILIVAALSFVGHRSPVLYAQQAPTRTLRVVTATPSLTPDEARLLPTVTPSPIPSPTPSPTAARDTATDMLASLLGIGSSARSVPPACSNRITGQDRALFDAANGRLSDADSHAYTYDGLLGVQRGDEEALFELFGDGFLASRPDGRIDWQTVSQGALILQVGESLARERFTHTFITDSSVLYMQAANLDTGVTSPMFAITFADALTAITGSMLGTSGVEDLLDITALFDLSQLEDVPTFFQVFEFGQFMCTTRQPNTLSGQAHFTSTIDLIAFLNSPAFSGVIEVLLRISPDAVSDIGALLPFGGGEVGALLAPLIGQAVALFVPEMTFEVNQYAALTDETITRTTFEGRIRIAPIDQRSASTQITLQGAINYFGYDQPYALDVPTESTSIRRLDEIARYIPGLSE
jgi:hypothetical protein